MGSCAHMKTPGSEVAVQRVTPQCWLCFFCFIFELCSVILFWGIMICVSSIFLLGILYTSEPKDSSQLPIVKIPNFWSPMTLCHSFCCLCIELLLPVLFTYSCVSALLPQFPSNLAMSNDSIWWVTNREGPCLLSHSRVLQLGKFTQLTVRLPKLWLDSPSASGF